MKTITLGVFLGASLLLNAVLAAKLSKEEAPRPDRPPAPAAPPAAPALETQLALERKENQALRARLDEAARAARAVEPPRDAAAEDRAQLRRLIRTMLKAKSSDEQADMDPKEMAELSAVMAKYMAGLMSPSSDPANFVAFLAGSFEIMAEELGVPFSPDQKRRYDDLSRSLAERLSAVPSSPAIDRVLGELEAQKGFFAGLSPLLTPEQTSRLQENDLFRMEGMGRTRGFSGSGDAMAGMILQDWSKSLSLSDNQKLIADGSARLLAEELRQLGLRPAPAPGAATATHAFDLRIEALNAQRRALEALLPSLTDAQRAQLDQRGVWEYRFMPSASSPK